MEYIQPYLDYFSAHPEWAIVVIFLIALGEALLIIGLFVPSTAVLVGAGMLVGSGHLPFWPVFIATCLGAIIGDQLSYWAGRLFGTRLKTMWPLNRYPSLVQRGEDFVRLHGGKSIAVGRFVPGVKAVVPGIVGMLGMSQPFFIFVNVTSGIFWGAAHVFPGILIGQGLALAGDLSGRLLVVLLVLLAILAVAGWMIRLLAASFRPHFDRLLRGVSSWALARRYRPVQRFARAISPDNTRSTAIVVFGLLTVICIFALVDLMFGLVVRQAVSNLDLSVATLVSEWRNAPADELMVGLSMLADRPVIWSVGTAVVVWLFFWRTWRAGLIALALMLSGELLSIGLGLIVNRSSPVTGPLAGIVMTDGRFPSGHALMAALVLGLIAVLASHAMGRWSKAVVAATCSIMVIAICFSRIYLGADWLSDILGGLLVALVLAALFGMVIEALPARRIQPLWLMGVAALVLLLSGAFHISKNQDAKLATFERPVQLQQVSLAEWTGGKWLELAGRRIDLAGPAEEVFAAQWLGELAPLESTLVGQGWKVWPKWKWRDAISYLDVNATLETLPPRPLLHQGLKAKLTLTRDNPSQPGSRDVVRVYRSNFVAGGSPVFLMSFSSEIARARLSLYAMPLTFRAGREAVENFDQQFSTTKGVKVFARANDPDRPRFVFGAGE